jgi:hypothetical protein
LSLHAQLFFTKWGSIFDGIYTHKNTRKEAMQSKKLPLQTKHIYQPLVKCHDDRHKFSNIFSKIIMKQNELDKALHDEIMHGKANKKHVEALISAGANINAATKYGDNMLKTIISDWEADGGSINFETINMLIEFGIELNDGDGFNCLFDAWLRHNYDLVELLLKNGANPNCISEDSRESLLDWVEWDRHFEVDLEHTKDLKFIDDMDRIIELLKQYGAKSYAEIMNM